MAPLKVEVVPSALGIDTAHTLQDPSHGRVRARGSEVHNLRQRVVLEIQTRWDLQDV